MIVTVTLNAAIDKRYVVSEFEEGEVNRVSTCEYTPGGKGLNVSKPLKILGAELLATGLVGGFAGQYLAAEVTKLGIANKFFQIADESRSCINIWDEKKKTQTEFLEPGVAVSEEEQEAFLKEFAETIKEARVVTISGSVPKGIPLDYYNRMIDIVKTQGKQVILDTSSPLLDEGIKAKPTMIKPNIDEIRSLTGRPCDNLDEIMEAARGLQQTGIPVVVVSLGGEGAIMACEDGLYQALVPKVEAVNTVGCGDAMIAGFAYAFDQGYSPAEALRMASSVSTASAMYDKTGFFKPEDQQKLFKEIEIKKRG
ncbi:tagatose 6-phosphate kinase [Lachnospiraceae bacterium PF1-21]|uniref:Tagatose-6-phosphate kinase n=1 Tax=Ohessyouella blattaphilus TaxID=2949333 RepID=A0ABT1EJS6_9FIRM|nr:1-phosphofructokinase [Ohessyouella blattaphilus]MCP1110948.1 1-phosphofructokinase [Ohessyouella blattaphilus]MCR8564342.1 1-phosphofructokinase [Ohessyouella blattaphilus]